MTVAHVVDFCRRYPSEVVTFCTRVDLGVAAADLVLRISLPDGLELESYRTPPGLEAIFTSLEVDESGQYLAWAMPGEISAGTRYEFEVQARVAPARWDRRLASRAALTTREGTVLDEETVTIAVSTKGRYLGFLPEFYEQDELLGRFLMLFESFWAPIEGQIDNVSFCFAPKMAPARLVPWLATWMGLSLDGNWTEEQQRQLLQSAVSLYRRRGTRAALQEYLEIYTGERVDIIEHRANNFCLGPDARLGIGVALGKDNVPHTFTVIVRLPPAPAQMSEEERVRYESDRRRMIESIIEREKPGHTRYTLRVETV